MRCLILISLISLAFAIPATKNGGRIVGGQDIAIEKVPYQVSVETKGEHSCGGSIVSPNFIVSAAHCYQNMIEKDVKVRAGTSIRKNGGQFVNVKKINNHPNYTDETIDYDVSVLELETKLVFGISVAKIALPSKATVWPCGTNALITGWGLLAQGDQELPDKLQGATVELMNQQSCIEGYGSQITERMFCAGFDEGGVDSCSSDSGGPLQIDGILAGIVSFGNGCAKRGYPGVYTNVSVVLDYIQEIIA